MEQVPPLTEEELKIAEDIVFPAIKSYVDKHGVPAELMIAHMVAISSVVGPLMTVNDNVDFAAAINASIRLATARFASCVIRELQLGDQEALELVVGFNYIQSGDIIKSQKDGSH